MTRDNVPYVHWLETWWAQEEARRWARKLYRKLNGAALKVVVLAQKLDGLKQELSDKEETIAELRRQCEFFVCSNGVLQSDIDKLRADLANSQLRTEAFINQDRQTKKLKSDLDEAEREIVRLKSRRIFEEREREHGSIFIDELPY